MKKIVIIIVSLVTSWETFAANPKVQDFQVQCTGEFKITKVISKHIEQFGGGCFVDHPTRAVCHTFETVNIKAKVQNLSEGCAVLQDKYGIDLAKDFANISVNY